MRAWPKVKLREVIALDLHKESIDPSKRYEMVGVLSFGKGLFGRETIEAGNTSYKYFLRLKEDHIVMSQLFGWEGALALSTTEFAGRYVSPQFPTFLCDPDRIDRHYLGWVMRQPSFWSDLGGRAKGMGDRRRTLNPESLFESVTPLPPLSEQKALVARLDALAEKTRQVEAHLAAVERDAERLVRAYIFQPPGEQATKRPMSELVAQRPPDVTVDGTVQYRFAGVYSFGRGVFPSVVKAGSEFAYERLSTVRAGDFTYPKLMAWEGALGVVPPECDGMVVSPEFPVFSINTDEVLPELLDIYFRTPEIWPELAELSGGTNVRRRRLQPSAFLAYEMPVPSMATQLKLREAYRRIRALKVNHATISQANAALLPATLERVFSTEAPAHV
ncbi:MAG: restriction endonuclease subunit S [Betaproteobacteria bacterium]|nr:restriction endonuclease subunit S [Betaproteobacteria bacterium]